MNSAEIRQTYLAFFEARDHKRMASASLVPSAHDPSVLLTTAGMQPFKPWFLGQEAPPHPRLTSCQKCFRTTDIENVGNTARHLTFFEMLGNFSFGDYFKQGAIEFGWELSTEGFGFAPEQIWITVFAGDEELGLGPDEEAIEAWLAMGVPAERIVRLPRSENFWQAGPVGPCGPCSELYLDRGPEFGGPDDRPGDDSERFLEFWNLVFMQYDLAQDGSLTPLPEQNIDTGMGLDRMAAILQDVPSVFETDLHRPLIALAEELSGRRYDQDFPTTRAMRIMADHSRAMAFLAADGVVPSNEDRGYILRRIMRRAIQQGRVLEIEPPYLERFAECVIQAYGEVYPELGAQREAILKWVRSEEEGFGRTLDHGTELLAELVAAAKRAGAPRIEAAEAFKLHDTFGFPFELTKELLAEQGLSVDDQGFEALMNEQRTRARAGAATAERAQQGRERALAFAGQAAPTRFVGYETVRATTGLAAVERTDDGALVKLEESPFYAEGGGQVADGGWLRWPGGEARVTGVYRLGDDQALAVTLAEGEPQPGTQVQAEVDWATRHATMANHTATHLLHAALRERLGTHVRQAGSAVRPDKLRFDFSHGAPLGAEDLSAVEDRVNEWVKGAHPVRALQMSRNEAEALGAMALFGEKYGEWVRMVEVESVSRELCGGTHVTNTAEVGIFAIASEGSSAANVRRIEALTGPAAIDWFRDRAAALAQAGTILNSPQDPLAGAHRAAERLAQLEAGARSAGAEAAQAQAGQMAAQATEIDGIQTLVSQAPAGSGADQKALLVLADQIKAKAGDAAIVLGGTDDAKVALVANFSPAAVQRGLSAVEVIREAAAVVGGGGGGREAVAQAGGKDPAKLDEALARARQAIERTLASKG